MDSNANSPRNSARVMPLSLKDDIKEQLKRGIKEKDHSSIEEADDQFKLDTRRGEYSESIHE